MITKSKDNKLCVQSTSIILRSPNEDEIKRTHGCYTMVQSFSGRPELNANDWDDILIKLKKYGLENITFAGPEPTKRDDLPLILEISSSRFCTKLQTDGVNLTDSYCKELYKIGLCEVQILLYSNVASTHNQLTASNNYKRTIDGIKKAVKEGLTVVVSIPLCKYNASECISTLQFVKELGVKSVKFSGFIVDSEEPSTSAQKLQLSSKELFETLKEAAKFCDDNNMHIDFNSPGLVWSNKLFGLGLDIPSCDACLKALTILPNGDVVPCESWTHSQDVLGNILKTKWYQILNNINCFAIRQFSTYNYHRCPFIEMYMHPQEEYYTP